MNLYFDAEPQYIYYANGHKHNDVQYITMPDRDLAYMRYMYSMPVSYTHLTLPTKA